MTRNEYKTILIDPPWNERGCGKSKRGADRHYPLLKTHQIIGVIYQSGVFIPHENSHLYLWATNNFFEDALFVIKSLGFRYITTVTWNKDKIGLGQYHRGRTEHMLFAVRGRLPVLEKGETSFYAPRTEHSRKPEKSYQLIEKCSPPPRLEMFGTREREGWTVWGNNVKAEETLWTLKTGGSGNEQD